MTEVSVSSFVVTPAPFDVPLFNYVPNPSAEVDATGWHGVNSAVVTVSTDWAQSGSQSFKLTPDTAFGDPTSGFSSLSAFPLYVDPATVDPRAQAHTMSAYLYTTRPGLEARVSLFFWYAGSGVNQVDGAYTAIGSTPTRLSASGVPTSIANSAIAVVGIRTASPFPLLTNADLVYADDIMVSPGSTLYDYFDGDTADDAVYSYDWTQAPNSSISVRTTL